MNRYVPNEPTSPVPLAVLALLMRSDDTQVSKVVLELAAPQRAALAVYCFTRSHMRSLGLRIARDCAGRDLIAAGGATGGVLLDQIGNGDTFDVGSAHGSKRKVTLARFAA